MRRSAIILALAMLLAAWPAASGSDAPVVVINIKGEIDGGQAALVHKALTEARAKRAKAIFVEIDTFGGLVDAATVIRDQISDAPMDTICYVKNRAWSAGALARLALPEAAARAGAASSYRLHPALLDACLQTLVAAVGGRDGNESDDRLYLPIALESCELNGRPGTKLWSRAVVRPAGTANAATLMGDLTVYDETGAAVGDEAAPLSLDPAQPRHLYDLSKALGENIALTQTGGRGAVARLANVFDWAPGGQGFLSEWLARAPAERTIALDSSPEVFRDYIHLDDVVDALMAMLSSPEAAEGGAIGLVENGDAIIIDGMTGEIQVRPGSDVQAAYAEKARLRARRQEQYRALRDKPAVTKDGVPVEIQLNAGLLVDLPNLDDTGATGVGLFRTEILFMVAPSLPRAQAQEGLYRTIIDIAGRRPVTFRTLDIGGDKVLPYLKTIDEENPALGWRAVRIGLDRPALLRTQMRALLGAARDRELKIMLPMVATYEEFEAAQAMLTRERERMRRLGQTGPKQVHLGIMLEVPSLLFDLERVFAAVDFVSIGTNDLMQFTFAVDRENAMVANRFDTLHPSFLRALARVAALSHETGKPVSICGEMAGKPIEVLALLGLGFRSFSMSPSSIGPVKALVRAIDLQALEKVVHGKLGTPFSAAEMRAELAAFAAANDLSF